MKDVKRMRSSIPYTVNDDLPEDHPLMVKDIEDGESEYEDILTKQWELERLKSNLMSRNSHHLPDDAHTERDIIVEIIDKRIEELNKELTEYQKANWLGWEG